MLSETTLRRHLLDWYDAHARDLPWRISPSDRALGKVPDPYRVWLSEIMLQQTTIATVKPYFARFLAAYPTLEHLADAPLEPILALWAGLGYYARGRNLHACAIALVKAGGFPTTAAGLAEFPGIGPYTSAAIASIAFDDPCVPVDGNVERVLSRLLKIDAVLPAGKPVFRDVARRFEDIHRPGDFAQALMDLGSTICTPRNPDCQACPWSKACLAQQAGDAESYPRKAPKKAKPTRYGAAFVHINPDGILVEVRPDKGLLGGMLGLPGSDWAENTPKVSDALALAPIPNQMWHEAAPVQHIFTHFELNLSVWVATTNHLDNRKRVALTDLDQVALPSVMMKAIKFGLETAKARC
jgi:A/G-specific adenine glycosylase